MQIKRTLFKDDRTHTIVGIGSQRDIEVVRYESPSDDLLRIKSEYREDIVQFLNTILAEDHQNNPDVGSKMRMVRDDDTDLVDAFATLFGQGDTDPFDNINSLLKDQGIQAHYSCWGNN